MEKPDQFKVRIKYREAPHYRKVVVSGVSGGPTPSGGLLCDFFVEYPVLPSELNVTVDGGRPVNEEPRFEEGEYFLREQQVGMVLPPHVAKSIGQWLLKWADKMMESGRIQDFTTRH